jgi:phage terminase small subunit
MTTLLSGKRKLFTQAILQGTAPHAAAISAGYSERSSYQSASRLLKEPEIARAIRNAVAAKETTLNQLDEARILALTTRDAMACVRAIELEAKIHGVIE